MMNSGMKAVMIDSQQSCAHIRAALFHFTPVLYRRRRNHFNYNGKQHEHAKEALLRQARACADHLFKSWQSEHNCNDPSSSEKRSRNRKNGPLHRRRSGFQFSEDDADVETIFQAAFGGNRHFYIYDEDPWWRSSSGYYNNSRTSWSWRGRIDDEYGSSSESDNSESDLASDRTSLGLSASGPLKIEDVKDAYRLCALKWHPDRHHGSSKAAAEEKFKICNVAYRSLCDKLAPD